jgi:hypothetical protein
MYKVQIFSNDEIVKEVKYTQKMSINKIVSELIPDTKNIVTYKVNNQFAHGEQR